MNFSPLVRATLLTTLIGLTTLYSAQTEQQKSSFTIALVNTEGEAIDTINFSKNLQTCKVSTLYSLVKNQMLSYKDNSPQQIKLLQHIDGGEAAKKGSNDQEKIKKYIKENQILFLKEKNDTAYKELEYLKKDINLQEAGIKAGKEYAIFMPYYLKFSLEEDQNSPPKEYSVNVDHPDMDLSLIINKLKKQEPTLQKLGIEVVDPVDFKQINKNGQYKLLPQKKGSKASPKITIKPYKIGIQLGKNPPIQITSLNNINTVQELRDAIHQKGEMYKGVNFIVKITTIPGNPPISTFFSFQDVELLVYALYDFSIENGVTYKVAEKEPPTETEPKETPTQVEEPPTKTEPKETPTQVEEAPTKTEQKETPTKTEQNENNYAPYINSKLVENTSEQQNKTLEMLGLKNGEDLLLFKKWKFQLMKCVQINKNTNPNDLFKNHEVIVKEPNYTFDKMKQDYGFSGNFFLFNEKGNLINSNHELTQESIESTKLIMTDLATTVLFHNGGKSLLPFCFDKNMTMEELTNFLSKIEKEPDIMILTKKGQKVNIKNTLNKNKDQLLDSIYYTSDNPQITIIHFYKPTIKWNMQNQTNNTKTAKLKNFQAYDTLETLLKKILPEKSKSLENIKEVTAYQTTTYTKEQFKTIQFADLDRADGKPITLSINESTHQSKSTQQNKPTQQNQSVQQNKPTQQNESVQQNESTDQSKSTDRTKGKLNQKTINSLKWIIGALAVAIIVGLGVWGLIKQKSKQIINQVKSAR